MPHEGPDMTDPAQQDKDREIDLAAIAEDALGGKSPSPEKPLVSIEPGDWVSAKPEHAAHLDNLSNMQVIGADPEKPGNVFVPTPDGGVRSVPAEFLAKEDIKAVEAGTKKMAAQYEGNINQADVKAREQYRREVAEGKRQPGDMSGGLGM